MSNRDYYQNPNNNPYKVRREQSNPREQPSSPISPLDFNEHRICPACGKIIKISHNFCKFCGSDLSSLSPIGKSDEVTKTLADTAISDPSPEVRKEAVASLAEFGEYEVLGVLSYILLNDPNEDVRSEAAEELGKFHHPHSLDVFAKALKDKSPIVRKKAIDGLKNIKKMIKKREPLGEKPEKIVQHAPDAEEIPIMDLEASSEEIKENESKSQKDEPEKSQLDSVESSEDSADEEKEQDYYRL
jgi:hypothetical protein